jgi:hypothetical protein
MVQSGVVKLFPDNPAIMNQVLQLLAHLEPIDWNCYGDNHLFSTTDVDIEMSFHVLIL